MNHIPFLQPSARVRKSAAAFTRMELLVVVAIILVILVIAIPVYTNMRKKAHKQVALEKIRTLAGGIATYANQNGGLLPMEDAPRNDTWGAVTSPAAKDAWYNAIPRVLGRKGAGDYTSATFYTDDNILFLPGANYPDKKKFIQPMFAIAYNTKLERKDEAGKKERMKLAQIKDQARTVAFLEQGLLNEDRTLPVQTKTDYDGSPKGSAKSFVGRYNGEGVIGFMDGHAEFVKATDVLTNTGDFPFPQTPVIWTANPEEDANKDSATNPAKEKKK